MNSEREPFRWTERRAARLFTLMASGAVVAADVVLLVVFLRVADTLPGGWKAYWDIPAGIFGVLLFAGGRFLRQLNLFLRDV